jgi:SNF2 family DNA or RNA helicase
MNKRVSNSSFQDDFDFDDEDEYYEKGSTAQSASGQDANALIIEKILGRKISLNDETGEMEELFYIKWKNFSYLHASWERKEDLEEVDPNGKSKIKRFLTSPLPLNILGETAGSGDGAGLSNFDGELIPSNFDDEDIEYFNPELVEVDRIISCDVFDCIHSKARKPEDLVHKPKPTSSSKKRKATASIDSYSDEGGDDDVNDIRYFVKWRGQPYSECTWERWEDIKSYYSEVWTFWQFQKPPKLPILSNNTPALSEYRKLEKSPMFGVSKMLPQAETPNGFEDGLKLRDYQLEGVNWLLWNWWHKRSCILADEM